MANELGIRQLWSVRIYGIIVGLMLMLAFFFCIARGTTNHSNFLLAINILGSAFYGGMVTRWYSVGDLAATKIWYVILLGMVLIMQAVVVDVWAFHDVPIVPPQPNVTTTEAPLNVTITSGDTTSTNTTL